MDHRILLAAVVGLVLVAVRRLLLCAGPKIARRAQRAGARRRRAAHPAEPACIGSQADRRYAGCRHAAPARDDRSATIEAEIARTEHADLQVLLKRHFADEYQELMEFMVRRRPVRGHLADDAAAQEMLARFQEMMRPKLKYAAAARVALIDKLASNEIELFHALGTEGASFVSRCLARTRRRPRRRCRTASGA